MDVELNRVFRVMRNGTILDNEIVQSTVRLRSKQILCCVFKHKTVTLGCIGRRAPPASLLDPLRGDIDRKTHVVHLLTLDLVLIPQLKRFL